MDIKSKLPHLRPFSATIVATYGAQGQAWLRNLPRLVEGLALQWGLRDLHPLENSTYSYVLTGFQGIHPIVLKLCPDPQEMALETAALRAFQGFGAVGIREAAAGALLLDQAVPGATLASLFPGDETRAMEAAVGLMARLHQAPVSSYPFPSLDQRLAILDQDWDIPQLAQARILRDRLVATATPPVLLHGDLHQGNILSHGADWIAIDPKGVLGDPAYEVAPFVYNPMPALVAHPQAAQVIARRIQGFSKRLNLDPQRVRDWCFVQGVLASCWAVEDGQSIAPFQGVLAHLS